MSDPIKSDEVHPRLRTAVKEFLLKCKYPYIVKTSGYWDTVTENGASAFYKTEVEFFDPHAKGMKRAGGIAWLRGDFGRPHKMRVITRNMVSPRYAHWERKHSIETTDERKATKAMLEHITPYTLLEVADDNRRVVDTMERNWKNEHSDEAFTPIRNIAPNILVEEMHNLIAQGVQFKTAAFQKIANSALTAFKETKRRMDTTIHKYFVTVGDNGRAALLTPNSKTKEGVVTTKYDSFEQLPEFVKEKISMLKVVGEQKEVEGVGVMVNPTMFWVLEVEEPVQ